MIFDREISPEEISLSMISFDHERGGWLSPMIDIKAIIMLRTDGF